MDYLEGYSIRELGEGRIALVKVDEFSGDFQRPAPKQCTEENCSCQAPTVKTGEKVLVIKKSKFTQTHQKLRKIG